MDLASCGVQSTLEVWATVPSEVEPLTEKLRSFEPGCRPAVAHVRAATRGDLNPRPACRHVGIRRDEVSAATLSG